MNNDEYKVEETRFGTRVSHPSYGTLLFSRRSGNVATPLFGSSIKHKDVIAMKLYHADITRRLHEDSIYGNKVIAEVEMSYSQFAEAITSMNMGTGVPVTIIETEKDGRIPPCNFTDKRMQFNEEFKEKRRKVTEDSQNLISEIAALFSEKKSLTKADKENILNKLHHLNMNIGSDMDFISDQFNEQMDKTVLEAKGEIEAFMQNKISTIANAALIENRDEVLKLGNSGEDILNG